MNGYTVFLHSCSQIIECSRLSLALELYTIIVQIEDGVGVSLVGIHEGRVNIVVADGLLPHAVLLQFVSIRIGAYSTLVVIETFVHDIPLSNLTLVLLHDIGDMTLHDIQRLLTGPVLVVGLTAIGRNPIGRLLVPHQTVTTHNHFLTIGEAHQFVGGSEDEFSVLATKGLRFHFVLGHQHIELEADSLRLWQAGISQVVLIQRDCRTNILTVLVGIILKRFLVGSIINTVVVESAHRTFWVIRIVRIVVVAHIFKRYETQHKDHFAVLLTLHDFPCVLRSLHIEMPVTSRLALDSHYGELVANLHIGAVRQNHLDQRHSFARSKVLSRVVILHLSVNSQLIETRRRANLNTQLRFRMNE